MQQKLHYWLTLFCFILGTYSKVGAQTVPAPTALIASYKKFSNRIELSWQGAEGCKAYHIYRKENARQGFEMLGSVAQNRYVDRNRLRGGTEYIYYVRSVDQQGRVSASSNEAIGALVVVADTRDSTSLQDSSAINMECLRFNISDSRYSAGYYSMRYGIQYDCTPTDTVQLRLFYSTDQRLDSTDIWLRNDYLLHPKKRGAIIAKSPFFSQKGFLLLEIKPKSVQSWVVARAVR
jgi:hypothetical protein